MSKNNDVLLPTNVSQFSCTLRSLRDLLCNNGEQYAVEREIYNWRTTNFWLAMATYIALALVTLIASYYIMAISAVDVITLKVVRRTGTKKQRLLAQNVFRILKNYHSVLVTLVVFNAAAEETMPLILDRMSNPLLALVATALIVVLFGQLVPLFLYQKYGIVLGTLMCRIICLCNVLMLPISYPLGHILSLLVGEGHTHIYCRRELKELIRRHGPHREPIKQMVRTGKTRAPTSSFCGQLSDVEVEMIHGVLALSTKVAADAMIPLDKVFMLEYTELITEQLLNKITRSTHRLVPIYSGRRDNVMTILSTRRLAMVNPSQQMRVDHFVRFVATSPHDWINVVTVPAGQPLIDLTRKFRLNTVPRMVMVVKCGKAVGQVIGITTQQEVLKAMLRDAPDVQSPPPSI